MKKIISIVTAVALCASAANAQGLLSSILGGSSNNSSSTATSVLDLIKGSATQNVAQTLLGLVSGNSAVDLTGTWTYNGTAVAMSAQSVLANVAATAVNGTVESKIDEVFAKVGVKPGFATLTFSGDYNFTFAVGKIKIPGTWTQEADKVTLKFGKALTFLTLDGVVKGTADGCEVLFDADKFISFVEKACAVISKISSSTTVATLSSLVSQLNGVDAGFKLKK